MERLGADTWAAALDFLYDQAAHRAMGDPAPYAALRASFFGATRRPGAGARPRPRPIADVLDEFRDRLAGGQMNAQHPRQFGYFTPPPLPVSMMGELLAQMTNQGVDVWHAGPLATFVEEEVVRWLCDLVGYGPESFGLLTSGGVMANFMGMALARDIHLGRLLGAGRAPRGRDARGRPRLHLGPDPLLDRAGARPARASRPRRSSSSRRTSGSGSAARRSPRPSPATAPPA